jgi:hypothetical protein
MPQADKTARPRKTRTARKGPQSRKNDATAEPPVGAVTSDERRRRIAEAAYLRAEHRGFRGGSPVQDWLEAEAEVDAALVRGGVRGRSGSENP